jgi:hypothetical protein
VVIPRFAVVSVITTTSLTAFRVTSSTPALVAIIRLTFITSLVMLRAMTILTGVPTVRPLDSTLVTIFTFRPAMMSMMFTVFVGILRVRPSMPVLMLLFILLVSFLFCGRILQLFNFLPDFFQRHWVAHNLTSRLHFHFFNLYERVIFHPQEGLILGCGVGLSHLSLLADSMMEISLCDLFTEEVLFGSSLRFIEGSSVLVHPLDHIQ